MEVDEKTKVCVYCRVSTGSQELVQQIQACNRFCEYKGLLVAEIFEDVGSGKNFNRPGFYKMVRKLRNVEFGGVVVFRLDRLGRSVLDLANFLVEMDRKGIRLYSVNENLDRNSAIGKLTVNMIMAMAEFERESISEATRQRLKALKERGMKLGRPPGSRDTKKRKRSCFKRFNDRGGF